MKQPGFPISRCISSPASPSRHVDTEFVFDVVQRMRPRDFEELRATSHFDTRDEIAHQLSQIVMLPRKSVLHGYVWHARPVACFGAIEAWPGMWSGWMVATSAWPKVAKSATKHILRAVLPEIWQAGAHRMEARSLATYETAHRWMERLGARAEATLENFGKEGQDFKLFVWERPYV